MTNSTSRSITFTHFLIIIVIIVLSFILARSSKVKRRYHFARQSKNLKLLAQLDFASAVHLQSFKQQQRKYQKNYQAPLMSTVDNYLQDYATDARNGISKTDHVERTTRNPLAMFRLIRRVARFLNSNKSQGPDLIPDLPLYKLKDESHNDTIPPVTHDLMEAAAAILQIHFTYNLNVSELAAGKVNGIQTQTRLQATDCLHIGITAKRRKIFTLAIEWLKEAKRLAKIDGTADVTSVQVELLDTIIQHDRRWALHDLTDEYFFVEPLRSLHAVYNERIETERDVKRRKFAGKGGNSSYWQMNVLGLCSVDMSKQTPEASSSHLFCWLEFKIHKILTVGPLKMEFLSRYPDIVQIHDAIHTDISPDDVGSMEVQLNKMVETMMGFVSARGSNASDTFQVVNHIPGGHKDIQVDVQDDESQSRQDSMATAMVYLNTVEQGGFTVFPTTFAKAVPAHGSAVFWFNTFSDGSPDFSTTHADCPVALGEKWVAYKQIGYYEQFAVRKCSLKPQQRLQILVNGKARPLPRTFHHNIIDRQELRDSKPMSLVPESLVQVTDELRKKYAHTPSSALESLVRLDWEIYQNVKRIFVANENNTGNLGMKFTDASHKNHTVLGYLQDFNETAYISVPDPIDSHTVTRLSGNPLAVYRTFWRFENYVTKWLRDKPAGQSGMPCRIRERIAKIYDPNNGPLRADLGDATAAILLIQFVHDFKSGDIARGIIAGRDAGIVLSAKQCIEIGHEAIIRGFHYQSIDWMETAALKIKAKTDVTVNLDEAQVELQAAKLTHDKLLAKSKVMQPTFYVSPVSGLSNLMHTQTGKETLYNKHKYRDEEEYTQINWLGVCQGRSHQTVEEKSKLFCWYESVIHPSFRIGPIKTEILSMHPKTEVVQYYDILGDKLTKFLQNDTGRAYNLSTVFGWGGTDTSRRMSATSAICQHTSEEGMELWKLVKRLTGLSSHEILLHSYPPGGHFVPHTDVGMDVNGEFIRMATFMFYVTEPETGGETGFPQAGVLVTPKAGSAVLWFSSLSSGAEDWQTYHGGCPVIFGEKRGFAHVIHTPAQNHLRCPTDPARRIEVLVNGKSKYGYASRKRNKI